MSLFFGAIVVGAIVWTYVSERVAAIFIRREALYQTSFTGSVSEGVVIDNPNREIVALFAFDDAWPFVQPYLSKFSPRICRGPRTMGGSSASHFARVHGSYSPTARSRGILVLRTTSFLAHVSPLLLISNVIQPVGVRFGILRSQQGDVDISAHLALRVVLDGLYLTRRYSERTSANATPKIATASVMRSCRSRGGLSIVVFISA